MASVQIKVDDAALRKALDNLGSIDMGDVLATLGRLAETQTAERIETEHESPDGTPWAAWSPAHAATRHSNHDLLQGEGDLVDSLQSIARDDSYEYGTNLIYANTHQHGDDARGISQREFIGVGDENLHEMSEALEDWLGNPGLIV